MTEETIVVLGGYKNADVVESYNSTSKIWTTHEDISDRPNKQTLAVTVGDVIIIIEVDNKRTRSFDFASRKWTNLECPPVYREGMKAAADGNFVYLTGGVGHLTRCDVYDVHSNQWSEGPNLNFGRFNHGSATLTGKIYCCGGEDEEWQEMASTEMFDPKKKEGKGRWTSVADKKEARTGLGLTSCSRFLWAVGGFGVPSPLTGLERYDPVSDIWTAIPEIREKRFRPSLCFFSGKLYVIGGITSSNGTLNTVEAYDPEENEWTDIYPLNKGRCYHASCVLQLPSP